jgi:hypothetical protein
VIARLLFRVIALLVGGRKSDRFWSLLDSTGIICFVGPNGSGKSLAMVASALDTLDGRQWTCFEALHRHHAAYRAHSLECDACSPPGHVARLHKRLGGLTPDRFCDVGAGLLLEHAYGERLVYSTVVLTDEDGEDHPRFRPLDDYRTLLQIEHSDVLFDEVAGVSDASDSGAIPTQVVNWLHTLRKADVRLRITTPAYGRCSKPVRQVVQVVVDARSFMPENRVEGRLWRPRRGFVFFAYDAFSFEDFTAGAAERLAPLARASLWRPGHRAESSYDTLGQVIALGHVDEHGLCTVCAGSRSRPRCACPTNVDALDDDLVVVETVSGSGSRVRSAKTREQLEAEAAEAVGGGPPGRQARQRRSRGGEPPAAVPAAAPEAPAPSSDAAGDLGLTLVAPPGPERSEGPEKYFEK